MLALRPFQKDFIRGATAGGVDSACLSLPRGNGKSRLAAHLVQRVLTPEDELFRAGTESVLCAASTEQARIVFRFVRAALEATGTYRFADAVNRCHIVHPATNTRIRVIGSNGRTAMGLVGCPWAICDEPGAWETRGGELLHDAIESAKGKPGSPLRSVYIGTLAPSRGGWWHSLIDRGTHGSSYVQLLQGDIHKWDQFSEIRRCNPLSVIDKEFRAKLLEERDDARADTRLKSRFLSYRLNLPTPDEAVVLLTASDWKLAMGRPVSRAGGQPIVAIDLGGGRSWSAAVAIFQSGRVEAVAIAPGVPGIDEQEIRDRVPSGTYRRLVQGGRLLVADGLRVPPVSVLVNAIRGLWGRPAVIVCDRFRLHELKDANPQCTIVPRISRWSESSSDIRALRRLVKDGPLSVEEESRGLLTASLAAAQVSNDTSGNSRMVKSGSNSEGRDDVASALVLAAGNAARWLLRVKRPTPRFRTAVVG